MKIPVMALFLLIAVSGCTVPSLDAAITEVVKASPMVQEFLEDYPNAQINVRYLSAIVVEEDEDFQANCEGVPVADYYKATIEDPSSGTTVMAWVSIDNQQLMCIFKHSPVTTTTIKTTTTKSGCTSHHETKCYEGHVYWYDSCGNKEEKKEYCEHGCYGGLCTVANPSCTDSDGGYDYYEKGKCYDGKNTLTDHCIDNTTLREYICNSNVCEESHNSPFVCPYGCRDGACLPPPNDLVCLDTDGKNHYVKGKAYNPETNMWLVDFCSDEVKLWESICNPVLNIAYFNGYECPYGCEDGACKGEDPCNIDIICEDGTIAECYRNDAGLCVCETCEAVECLDSDGGIDYYTQGISCNGDHKKVHNLTVGDRQEVGYAYGEIELNEIHNSTSIQITTYNAEGGLYRNATLHRFDIFYPFIYYVQSIGEESVVIYTYPNMYYSSFDEGCYLEYCYSDQYVNEWYCNNGVPTKQKFYCENGCKDGACQPLPDESECLDSDGGKNYYVKGTAEKSGIEGTYDCCKQYYSTEMGDATQGIGPGGGPCVYSGPYLYEAICEGNIPSMFVYECPNGCKNGTCIDEITVKIGQIINIVSATSSGITVKNVGTYSIDVTDLKVYLDGVGQTCTWTSSSVGPGETITADCACSIGQIVKVTAPGNTDVEECMFCTDSDGGKNYEVKGTAYGKHYVTGMILNYIDDCARAGVSPYQSLQEYYCYNNTVYLELKTCDVFCYHGTCVDELPQPEVLCSDSDGNDVYTAGHVYGEYMPVVNPDGIVTTKYDECFGDYLYEYICDEYGRIGSNIVSCSNGCEDGACLPE